MESDPTTLVIHPGSSEPNLGDPIWHVSFKSARESILSHGLDPRLGDNGSDCGLYVWSWWKNTTKYAMDFMRCEEADIWLVSLTEDIYSDLQDDPYFDDGYMAECFGDDPGAFFTLIPKIDVDLLTLVATTEYGSIKNLRDNVTPIKHQLRAAG